MSDIALLCADVDIEASMSAILARCQSLGIRELEVDLLRHPGHDPGVWKTPREILQPFATTADHALAVLDTAWDGNPHPNDPTSLGAEIVQQLQVDWGDRSAAIAIAIEPEVEMWIWSTSLHVATTIEWHGNMADLRHWLEEEGLWAPNAQKPDDPKEHSSELAGRLARPPAVLCSAKSFRR